MPQHVRRKHGVLNTNEMQLILKLASSRCKGSLKCPICDKQLSRLDMHLSSTHKLCGQELEAVLYSAKRGCILKRLSELRESGPSPPMATTLDVVLPVLVSSQPTLTSTDNDRSCRPSSDTLPVYQQPPASQDAPSSSPPPPSTPEASEKGRTPTKPAGFCGSVVNHFLDTHCEFSLRSDPSAKDVENIQTRRSHCMRFIIHMSRDYIDQKFGNVKFLANFERMRQ